MPNRMVFETSSNGIDPTLAKSLLDSLLSWRDGDPDRDASRFDYSPLNQRVSMMVRVSNKTDSEIMNEKASLETAIENINTNEGTNFEVPSDPGQTTITSTEAVS